MNQEEWWKVESFDVQPDKDNTVIDGVEKQSASSPILTPDGNDADGPAFASVMASTISSSLETQPQTVSGVRMTGFRTLEDINLGPNLSNLGQQWNTGISPLQYAPDHQWGGFYYDQNSTLTMPTSNYHHQEFNIPFTDAAQLQVSNNHWNTRAAAAIAIQYPMIINARFTDRDATGYNNATTIPPKLAAKSTIPKKNNKKKHDCPYTECRRKGELGFARRDNLTTHLRGVHNEVIPKKCRGNKNTSF